MPKTQSTIDRIIQTAQNKTPFIGPDELTKWLVERGWHVRSTQSFDSLGYHDLRVFPLNPRPAPWCIDGCTHPSKWPKFCAAIVNHFALDQDANLAQALEEAWDKHFVAGGLKFNSWLAVAKRARELLQPAQEHLLESLDHQRHERAAMTDAIHSTMDRVTALEKHISALDSSTNISIKHNNTRLDNQKKLINETLDRVIDLEAAKAQFDGKIRDISRRLDALALVDGAIEHNAKEVIRRLDAIEMRIG